MRDAWHGFLMRCRHVGSRASLLRAISPMLANFCQERLLQ